jgi:hypothetical protein
MAETEVTLGWGLSTLISGARGFAPELSLPLGSGASASRGLAANQGGLMPNSWVATFSR